jgi:hypothetical protein
MVQLSTNLPTNMEHTMTIYVLQYRLSGEDYQVAVFQTRSEAERVAQSFLYELFYNYEPPTSLPNLWLETLEEFCADHELGYIEITTHNLPQE